jgi:hypothetical protein
MYIPGLQKSTKMDANQSVTRTEFLRQCDNCWQNMQKHKDNTLSISCNLLSSKRQYVMLDSHFPVNRFTFLSFSFSNEIGHNLEIKHPKTRIYTDFFHCVCA